MRAVRRIRRGRAGEEQDQEDQEGQEGHEGQEDHEVAVVTTTILGCPHSIAHATFRSRRLWEAGLPGMIPAAAAVGAAA